MFTATEPTDPDKPRRMRDWNLEDWVVLDFSIALCGTFIGRVLRWEPLVNVSAFFGCPFLVFVFWFVVAYPLFSFVRWL